MCQVGFDALDATDDFIHILPRYLDSLGLLANVIRLDNLPLHLNILMCFIFLYFTLLYPSLPSLILNSRRINHGLVGLR